MKAFEQLSSFGPFQRTFCGPDYVRVLWQFVLPWVVEEGQEARDVE